MTGNFFFVLSQERQQEDRTFWRGPSPTKTSHPSVQDIVLMNPGFPWFTSLSRTLVRTRVVKPGFQVERELVDLQPWNTDRSTVTNQESSDSYFCEARVPQIADRFLDGFNWTSQL